MTDLLADLRYALRLWTKRPAFTVVVVATLALGIGANSAIFSVVDAALLQPLPYRQPAGLVAIYSQFPTLGFDKFWISPPEFLELRRWATSFDEVGAYRTGRVNVSGGDEPQRVRSAIASASLFRALGVDAELGRYYGEEEDVAGAAPVVLLGHDLWQRSFGGDRGLVGKSVTVDGAPRTVVGVMPAGFDVADSHVEVWEPLALDPADPGGRGSHYLYLIGRLKAGVTLAQARLELAGLLNRWAEEFPDTHVPRPERHPLIYLSLLDDLVGAARPAMLLLAGAVGLVLLIACANVANLLLARAESRQREVAVRTALGAARGRLVRQFLAESVLLALVGGAVGVVLAVWGVNAVLAANPEGVVRVEHIGLDGKVLAFTFAVALATGLLFGLAPALHARSRTFFNPLREGGRATVGRRRRLFRAALVVAEVALAAVLVIGAGLLLKSFWTLGHVDPGFEPAGALTLQLSLPESSYPEAADTYGFFQRLLAGLGSLPGVAEASAMTGLPPLRDVNANDTEFEGVPGPPDGPPQNVDYYQFVNLGYFRTMGVPLVRGRAFRTEDVGGAPVAVVDQRLAQVFWPDSDPIGKRLRPPYGDDTPWFTVVGVARDVKQGGLDRPAGTELYFLSDQVEKAFSYPLRTRNVVVRTAGDPLALSGAVREEVRRLDPALPIAGLQTLEQAVSGSITGSRFLALLVGIFALLALTLAAVGTYGVLSYSVEERRHEVGVRMALGARAGGVLRLILGQGLALVCLGLVLGLAGSWALHRLLASVLFAVAPSDPATLAVVTALLLAVALAACLVPARRATRVDPVISLRAE
jgi:putative ABC transport system permease protein